MPADEKLVQLVESIVPTDDGVIGAFVGVRGPRPGVEAFAVLPFGAVLIATSSYWFAVPAAVAPFMWVTLSRSYVTVARTQGNAWTVENGRRRLPRADSTADRLPIDAIRPPVTGRDQDEARRLARLSSTTE